MMNRWVGASLGAWLVALGAGCDDFQLVRPPPKDAGPAPDDAMVIDPYDGGVVSPPDANVDANPNPVLQGCGPDALTGTPPEWRPPSARRSACTRSDALTILSCVFDNQNCTQPVAEACRQCIITSKQRSPTYGPVILDETTGEPEVNVEGCVALESGNVTTSGCGAAVKLNYACEEVACQRCQPGTQDHADCIAAADQNQCAQFAQAVAQCQPYVDRCMQGTDIGAVAINLTSYFCGMQ